MGNYTDLLFCAESRMEIKKHLYLYSKALRSVGIMIAANGYEENARWAAKGCLWENG